MEELQEYLTLFETGVISREEIDLAFRFYLQVEGRAPRLRRELYGRFDLGNVGDEDVRLLFRFERGDIGRLHVLLGIPERIPMEDRYNLSGVTGLCILLRRLAYPNRLSDLEHLFGLSYSTLSKVANLVMSIILAHHGQKLEDLRHLAWLTPQRLEHYSQAIVAKRAPLQQCWAFIDGTARQICRPTVNQMEFYSGHKRYHCVKYQAVVAPDGMTVSLHGGYQGRRHDAGEIIGIWRESTLDDQLRRLCVTPTGKYTLYGDPAYPISDLLIAPYPNSAYMEPRKIAFNKAMASVRQAVEWGFGNVLRLFAFLDFSKNQKLLLQDVQGMYRVATILANCHTCLYGNQTSLYFNISPSLVEQYLS